VTTRWPFCIAAITTGREREAGVGEPVIDQAIGWYLTGYQSYVLIDACGTCDAQKREAGVARLAQSDAVVSDVFCLMCEVMADNAVPSSREVYETLDEPFGTLMGQVGAGLKAAK
jgi:hypothetical protein